MKLSMMLECSEVENEYADVEISFVTDSLEKCRKNCAFVCIEGKNTDGHSLADEAVKRGAVVLVAEKKTGRENEVLVKNTRRAYAYMCSRFFGNPSEKMKVIAITGTNGKSTTAWMVYSLLTLMGEKAGLIGTVENIIDGKREESTFTTPSAFEFNELLRRMADCGSRYCVCEVSSQALDQWRTYGSKFFAGVFTNITNEHLDYHKTFENYFSSKKKLFSQCKNAIINLDDSHAEDVICNAGCEIMTYATSRNDADLTAMGIKTGDFSVCYEAVMFSDIARVRAKGIGLHTVSNSLAAIAVMLKLGFDLCEVCSKMPCVDTLRGRGEKLDTDTPYTIIIDYAHTPDALMSILSALNREKKNRLIVLFGCGGDRDREKRAVMGNIVSSFSDIAVVTDDNPRNENEDEIISDILGGMNNPRCRTYVEKDREKAIRLALSHAKKDDIVLLAGKGHEAYQIIKDRKTLFDEREKVAEILR